MERGGERLEEEGEREEEEGERQGRKEKSEPRGERGGANKDKQRIQRGEGQGEGQGVRAGWTGEGYIPVASFGDNCRHSLFVKCYKRMPQNRVTGTARVTHLCASPSRTGGTHAKREQGGRGRRQKTLERG